MQAVSNAFKTAILGPDITPVREAKLTLVDNISIFASISVSAPTIDSAVVPATKAINGITAKGARWAFADPFDTVLAGGRCLAEDESSPNVVYPIDTDREGGWWGSTPADASGNIGGGGEVFTLTYATPALLQSITWYADAYLGTPVNFTVDYDPTGSAGYTTVATVTGYSGTSWLYSFGSPTRVAKLRITITKVSYPSSVAKLLEFEGGLTVDVTSRLNSVSVLVERQPDDATIRVGAASAGDLTLSLDNTDGLFSPNNLSSPYQPYLKANRKIRLKVGVVYADGSTELVPFGTYYTMGWDAAKPGTTASVKAQDRMKRLRERKYTTCPLSIGKTVDAIVKQALIDAGLGANEMIVNPSSISVPYAWCSPSQSFFDYLSLLAAAVGGAIYFDENDVFHFEDADFLKVNRVTSVMTLTDDNAVIEAQDSWNEGQVKNRVNLTVNALKLAASAQLWALQETLVVPAGGTLTINVTFASAATAITTPVVTAGAGVTIQSWTTYAMGGKLVLASSSLSDQNVTAVTVSGQALQTDGSNLIVIDDAALVTQDGARELAVANAFIQNRASATTLGYSLLSLYKNPPSKLRIRALGLPHLEIGDRLTVNSAKLGINQDYWLIRHNFDDSGSLGSDMDASAVFGELPERATMWHSDSNILVGNALTIVQSAVDVYGYYVHQVSPADGNSFSQSFLLRAGVYTLSVLGAKDTTQGKIDWYIDDVLVSTGQDWYAASLTLNVIQALTSVRVGYDGYHVLRGVVNGKNASSSNYFIPITKLWIKRAND